MEDSVVCTPPMSDLQKEDNGTTKAFLVMSLIRGGNLKCIVTALNSALCKIGKYLQETDRYLPLPSKAILQKLRIFTLELYHDIYHT